MKLTGKQPIIYTRVNMLETITGPRVEELPNLTSAQKNTILAGAHRQLHPALHTTLIE